VVARADDSEVPGEARLVAYLVAHDGAAPAASDLRNALTALLPDYMLPSAFVIVDAFPLTPNGKLDRAALPPPEQWALATRTYEAPHGAVETAIAAIWRDLLRLDQVGRHDHFFELGGHSLLAVRFASYLRKDLGIELPLRELFAHPILADLAQQVGAASRATLSSIGLADRSAPLPLSFAQQRLWVLDQLDHAAYHMPSGLRLTGSLDCGALQAALDRIVARHESLRTTFATTDGQPVQVFAPADCGFALVAHDLSMLAGDDQNAAVMRISNDEACMPFDLTAGPLIRGRLLRLDQNHHILLVTQHHIVSDGWSMGILVRELASLYTAFTRQQPDPLSALTIQYADYAVWQRNCMQGEALQRQADFWRQHLAGAPALLEMPTDRPRPAVQSHAGGTQPLSISPELTAGLRLLSQRHGATLFMTLLAGWAALLARMSGQDDVVVGTPFANRQRSEVEPLIGFFVNTLALRVKLDNAPSVAALIEQVKATTLDAHAHQDIPFEQVVALLNPARSLSHSPVFQTMLVLQNMPDSGPVSLPDLALSGIATAQTTARFDLSLSLTEVDDVLTGRLEYASDLFEQSTVKRMAQHFQVLLTGMVADEHRPVSLLPLLSPSQQQKLLAGFNDTLVEYPQDFLMHQLFEAQAAAQPDAVALVFEDHSVSYGELNRRANGVAHALLARGVRPDDRVALCTERSLEMVVGLFGVLKAGAAYVPLDPAYPAERLAYMLADSAPVAVLTQHALQDTLARLDSTGALPVLSLDDLAAHPGANPDPARLGLGQHHLAYVIYTSGSTGMPKGVMVEHAGLSNLVTAQIPLLSVTAHSRVLQFVSVSFDVSISEIGMALCSGARLYLAPSEALLPGAPLVHTLRRYGITHVSLPVAALAALPHDVELEQLSTVVVGGEALPPALAQRWAARCNLFNAYGPTEATVCVSQYQCSTKVHHNVPIGRPLNNTRIHLLDANQQVVPLGVVGEIHIGGIGLARGYLNRPTLTAERFIADPFSNDAGARLYKSGDLARYLPDGNIEYVGRNDFQVKLRGFRIELGEIETALAACDGVRDAAVIAMADAAAVPSMEKRLVAYIVPHEGTPPSPAQLRLQLSAVLPDYMMPSAFVTLDAFPLTPNGKLDRQAMPTPDRSALATTEYEAPLGATEIAVAAIWQDLLKSSGIGRRDHFFNLGGHSLLAVQLASRLRTEMGVELALREVFANPTLSDLAKLVDTIPTAAAAAIHPADRSQALPLSFAQQRLWFLDQLDHAASAAYHLPSALRLEGKLDRDALLTALNRIVARHESLRTMFVQVAGQPTQCIAPPECGFDLVDHDLSGLDDNEQSTTVSRIARQEARAAFDLSAGPMIRGRLLRLGVEQHILLVTQHHIVTDGWSIGTLVREFATLYTAFTRQQPDPLPPLPIQYADYAAWQRERMQGDTLQQQADFWRQHLAGAPALLEMPTDRPRPAAQSHTGNTVPVALSAELTAGLRALGQRHSATLFMTLLAGWSALLARMSGQNDVVVGTPFANRQRSEVEPLIGFFVNTLALRVQLDNDPSVAALIEQVKSTTLAAHAHQDLPFEQVVELVNPERSLGHSPIFQAMLTLLNMPDSEPMSLPGLTLSGIATAHTTAHYDLSLSLAEADGELVGRLEYASDLFDHSTVERLAQHFRVLLAGMVADEQKSVSALPLLSAEQRQQLLVDFNDTKVEYPSNLLIHQLFEVRASAQPDAIALVFEERRLSYGELNRRANIVAHALLALGIRPDDRVALCVERGPEMVAGLLGVLKAGAAYVPLDPAYPAERLAYMLTDSAPKAVLTQTALLDALGQPGSAAMPVLLLDALSVFDDTNPDPRALGLTPDNLAYVIYTSGSTGLPKGVMVEHASVLNFLQSMSVTPGVSDADTLLAVTTLSFDIAGLELYLPLMAGGRIVLLDRSAASDPARLQAAIDEHGITIIQATPATWTLLLSNGWSGNSRLRALCGGEALTVELSQRLAERVGEVWNLYGPTETTIWSTCRQVIARCSSAPIEPIGRPIANTRIYLLDRLLQPVPLGVIGQLYIGGAGLARAYQNRPELTDECFIGDPFDTEAGGRLYRTGDLARYLPDGNIEFLGRNDSQVKIRGLRIELGEIEAKLVDIPGVRQAAVVARDRTSEQPGDKHLVAYLLLQEGVSLQVKELRAKLSATLPHYMVPNAFVTLDIFPRTPNGKLDRLALPVPDYSAIAGQAHAEPKGPVETAIATIWRDLLNLSQVGRHDQFFELGGHSLLAMQLVLRLQEAFHVHVPVRALFDNPQLAALAEHVTELQFDRFLGQEKAYLEKQLDSLTEEELMALLEKEDLTD
jgi:amino acid adenylation domain-containing protein